MKQTIIFFKGVYDTLDLFTDSLKDAFEKMGFSHFIYDATKEEESKKELLGLLQQRENQTFAVVTFNNLGYNLDMRKVSGAKSEESFENSYLGEDRVNMWEYYDVPYINILMDHPFHYEKPLRNAPSTSIVLCVDRNHVKYIRRFYKNITQVDFLPHAGVELGKKHKKISERGIDVLYAGALPIYTVAKMIPDLSSIREVDGQKMAGEVLQELVAHPEKTTEQAVEEYLQAKSVVLSPKELHDLVIKLRFIDSYATSFFREQAVRILVESGVRVTTYGVGWNQCDWSDNPYLDYGGKVLAPQILPLMNNAKIVLNTMTWFKAGSHDRVFNGMLAGAAVVTDDSTYMRREFTDGKELVMFSLKDLGTLPERVFDLFGHEGRMQEMADCGYEAAKNSHSWENRAEYIRECFLD